jgi:hypothetical protein
MKSQKSQQRWQEPRLQIFGFSYLRGRDLSLKNIRHAFRGCVIENRGSLPQFIWRQVQLFEDCLLPGAANLTEQEEFLQWKVSLAVVRDLAHDFAVQ